MSQFHFNSFQSRKYFFKPFGEILPVRTVLLPLDTSPFERIIINFSSFFFFKEMHVDYKDYRLVPLFPGNQAKRFTHGSAFYGGFWD